MGSSHDKTMQWMKRFKSYTKPEPVFPWQQSPPQICFTPEFLPQSLYLIATRNISHREQFWKNMTKEITSQINTHLINWNKGIQIFSHLPEPFGCCDNVVVTLPPQEFFPFPPMSYRIWENQALTVLSQFHPLGLHTRRKQVVACLGPSTTVIQMSRYIRDCSIKIRQY